MTNFNIGDLIHGFKLISTENLEEYKGRGLTFRHEKTGCEVYNLYRDDSENLFSFVFKTPAGDNTGIPHIMEHSVLSGSRLYPVKDPFQAMMKGSMNTFLNAMTYPDKTVFPAATPVEKDYFNLFRVYADAVFFPLLTKETFMQEGHRLEFDEEGDLSISGIVYNEMKGAYGSPENIAGEWSYRSLFPHSPYFYDAGGEPEAIPDLTYQQFLDFHKIYYHPSNCRIFLYGDIPVEKQLKVLQEEFLKDFEAAEEAPEIPITENWSEPRHFRHTSPVGEDDGGDKATITLNWKGMPLTEPENLLAMEILSEMLLGNVGAPLYKAIVESGLGEDVSPISGLDSELRESVFTLGLRGGPEDSSQAFEELIIATLTTLADEGIPEEILKGALHQVEFRNREIRGGVPFGMRLMDKSLRGWLHGHSPSIPLRFSETMANLKEQLKTNSTLFEDLIRKEFIENKHRTTVVVVPDPEHQNRADAATRKRLSVIKDSLGEEGLDTLRNEMALFSESQNTPDSDEAIATIPTLHREDLPKDIRVIETAQRESDGTILYSHDFYTNGLVYVDIAIDVRGLDEESIFLLPLLSRMICTTGLPGIPYDKVANKLSMVSGGLLTFLESSLVLNNPGEIKENLFFRIKALEQDLDAALNLVESLFKEGILTDSQRIKDLLLEHRNDYKSSILPMGHSLASLRGASKISSSVKREEQWRGVEQYLFLCEKTTDIDSKVESVGQTLSALRDKIFVKNRMILNTTAAGDALTAAEKRGLEFLDSFSSGTTGHPSDFELGEYHGEQLVVPSTVGYASRMMPGSLAGTLGHSHELLLGNLLKTNFLWEEVRMKGGAYGVFASANGAEGLFSFVSYRDPDPTRSLGVFKKSLDDILENEFSQELLDKSVIGIVGKDAKPLSPGEKSMMGFRRDLYGITDELRRKNRQQILEATIEDVKNTAKRFLAEWESGVTVVLGGDALLKKAVEVDPQITERLELPF